MKNPQGDLDNLITYQKLDLSSSAIPDNLEFTAAESRNIAIDPKRATIVGTAPGSFGVPIVIRTKLELAGAWRTGQDKEFVGPTGDPEDQINDACRGAAVILLQTMAIPVPKIERRIYLGGVMELPRAGFGTTISIVCNDDNLDDNETNPTDPIRAHLIYEVG